ncbi:hypothetical protein EMCG_05260 [[Emmonsia] crescens]|uniref:Uncharacterized protein n=1 Tax=[Emmonsia] crescens TaxID=73230 RepID=A0A0G2HPL0_9EURO|nr:hypothetical protein EMCG_05260 [Emmonsia crescens UAMH 3008]
MKNDVSFTVRLVQTSHNSALKVKLHELEDIICSLSSVIKTDHISTLELIQFCSNDIKQIKDVNLTQCKVNLIVMFNAIVQEVKHQQCSKRKKTHDVTVDSVSLQKVIFKVFSDILKSFRSLKKQHQKLKRQFTSESK